MCRRIGLLTIENSSDSSFPVKCCQNFVVEIDLQIFASDLTLLSSKSLLNELDDENEESPYED